MKSKLTFQQSITAGAMAGAAAAVINAILFFIFHGAGVLTDDIFIQPNQPLTIVPILISSILPSIVGSIVFFLFEKYTNNGFGIFRILSIVLLVLSFVNPFLGIPGVTTGYAVVLNVMHVVVAFSLLYFINKKVQAA
jgi:uncharacterized membrane protein